jgi:hypothetical protein
MALITPIVPPDDKTRRVALERFSDLLQTRNVKESEWQALFEAYPFILSESLPVRFSGICSQLAIESGRPDFVFVGDPDQTGLEGYSGVIELKRPTDNIIRVYTDRHLTTSMKATQAISQVQHYLEELSRLQPCGMQRALTLGHNQYAFILIGTTAEIMRKCDSEVKQLQYRKLAPPGISIIAYDELFRTFQKNAAPVIVLNVMRPSYTSQTPYLSPQRFFGMIDPFDGSNEEAVLKLWTTTGFARIESGTHHIVFAVPRRLWPIGNNKLHADLEQAAGGIFPMIATELMGNLDAEAGKWRNATITATTRRGERRYAMFDDWWLSFYEGDRLYRSDGTLVFGAAMPVEQSPEQHP